MLGSHPVSGVHRHARTQPLYVRFQYLYVLCLRLDRIIRERSFLERYREDLTLRGHRKNEKSVSESQARRDLRRSTRKSLQESARERWALHSWKSSASTSRRSCHDKLRAFLFPPCAGLTITAGTSTR